MLLLILFCLITKLLLVDIKSTIAISIFAILFILFDCIIDFTLNNLKKEDNKLPISNHRYTAKMKNGDINVKKADIEMAIIYLSQVEDYIESKGLRNE